MNKVLINPANFKTNYIGYLNQCFLNWGNEVQYSWAFERKAGNYSSDIIVLANEEDEIIAGSGLSFRNIKTDKDETIEVAIFTGSWTLPNARGRGCFTQIIEVFEKICIEKGIPYLTAFVTENNGSYRRFNDLNYYCLEANNYFSLEVPFNNVKDFTIDFFHDNFPVDFFKTYYKSGIGKTILQYTETEFKGQFIDRVNKTFVIKIEENYFLAEENDTTFRLLFFKEFNTQHIKYISNFILKTRNKKTMFFLTHEENRIACENENFNVIRGFFTVKNLLGDQSKAENIFKNLIINLADKM